MAKVHVPKYCRTCMQTPSKTRAVYARFDNVKFERIGWLFLPCKHIWLDVYDPDSGTMFDKSEKR